ncbi:MAG: cytochrome c peroxidase [Bacteroidota bacterium]
MKNAFYLFLTGVLFCCFQSCTDEIEQTYHHYSDEDYELLSQYLNLPQRTYDYTPVTNLGVSSGAAPENTFHKATLGRVLFYDNLLSIDESTSCASCHHQSSAFADNVQFSEGLDGQITKRNTLPLGNTIGFIKYYGTDLSTPTGQFSWDESKASIDVQSEAAITNSIEMGHNMSNLTEKLKKQDYYQVLFRKVYGDKGVTETNILDALTEFVNSFSSRDSDFDKGVLEAGNPRAYLPTLSPSANNGREVFNDRCGSCHDPAHNAIILSSANNGLDLVYEDKGVGASISNPALEGVFKVPSLRNIELTGPYMHDGRFETLEEVIEHYSTGIQNHKNLHEFLKFGNHAVQFNFSDSEKDDLVAYLKTLTDNSFIDEVKWSDPFK